MRTRFKVGDQVEMTEDAIENYGEEYRDRVFTISNVSTKYMPASEFYAKGQPAGYHPGFDAGAGSALYDFDDDDFNNSLYDWELKSA